MASITVQTRIGQTIVVLDSIFAIERRESDTLIRTTSNYNIATTQDFNEILGLIPLKHCPTIFTGREGEIAIFLNNVAIVEEWTHDKKISEITGEIEMRSCVYPKNSPSFVLVSATIDSFKRL